MKYLATLYIFLFAMVFIINTAASKIKDDDTAGEKNGENQEMELKSTVDPEIKDDGTAGKNNEKKPEVKSKNKNKVTESNISGKNNEKKKEKKTKVKNGKQKNPSGQKMDLQSLKTIAQLFVSGFQNNFDDISVNTKTNKVPSLTLGPVGKMVATELIKEIWNITADVTPEDKGENSKKSSSGGKAKSGPFTSSQSIGKIFISEIHKDFGNITVADSTKEKKRPIWSLGPIGRVVAKEIIKEVMNMTDELVQEVRVENKMTSNMETTPAPMEMSTKETTPEATEMSTVQTSLEDMEMSTMQTTLKAVESSTMPTTPAAMESSTMPITPADMEMSTTSTEITTM